MKEPDTQQSVPYDPHIMRMLQEDSITGDSSISEMNVIPFIDICLVLLIIVLMSSVFAFQLFVFHNRTTEQMTTVAALRSDGAPNVIRVRMTGPKEFDVNGSVVEIGRLNGVVRQLSAGYSALEFSAPGDMSSQAVVRAWEKIREGGPELRITMNTLDTKK
ncbi:MAG: biopolymer transporter ExbD [Planctomycetota bacterium]|jgi:biopolymer transport protein ExbD|nr:biopolymer transporter ExbD [Planctomycetota bacterium]MDP7254651.1 biopolymer transporter ExbD [Planctomycetota bacterium]